MGVMRARARVLANILNPHTAGEACSLIGRVAVLKDYRDLGIGKSIMKDLIKWAQDMNLEKVWLSSQWHAHSFYLDLDFVCVGEIYKEAGIDHIKMYRVLTRDA